ncbi:type 1 glutamine amidotransferase domain-containing protein [Flavitalea flava]
MKQKKVLFVVTSADHAGSMDKKTGTWIEEFATPYYRLADEGVEITIASPKGGLAPIDPKSTLPAYSTPSVKRFFEDQATKNKMGHTVKLELVSAADYDAVFYPGGHGPMWDLPTDPVSISLIQTFYQQGKPTAFVCHGPAALENVTGANGDPLVKGKKVTGYTNTEETTGQTTDMVPFFLEDMLKSKGGVYERGKDWEGFAVADGQLITGQNPASAALVAEKVITALKISGAGQ